MADNNNKKNIDVGNFLISIINEHANLNMVALKFVIPVIKINRIPNRQLLYKNFSNRNNKKHPKRNYQFWRFGRTSEHYQSNKRTKKNRFKKPSTIYKKLKLEAMRDRSVNFARMCYHLNWTETHTKTVCVQMWCVVAYGLLADICWNDTFIMISTCVAAY